MQNSINDVPEDDYDISFEQRHEMCKIGCGTWATFPKDRLDFLFESVKNWRKALEGIEKPWLCWCIDDEWCLVQQRLVDTIGWTPVVGTDGKILHPKLIKKAVFVNFNEKLQLPRMYMEFPLEFVFLFTKKLAFWHSDFLAPVGIVKKVSQYFNSIANGEFIGVKDNIGRLKSLALLLKGKEIPRRWYEVIGCTTAEASQSQYECGCGWWRGIENHPNAKEKVINANPYWEHGVGIWFWEKYFGGKTRTLPINVNRYHYATNKPGYKRQYDEKGRLKGEKHKELKRSFDLNKIVKDLGLP